MEQKARCTCHPASWFWKDYSWKYSLECPVHGLKKPGIIPYEQKPVPVELSTLKNDEGGENEMVQS
jgi:hypothetical protein